MEKRKLQKQTIDEFIINSLCESLQQILDEYKERIASDLKTKSKHIAYTTLQDRYGYALIISTSFDTLLKLLKDISKESDIRKWVDQDIIIKNIVSLKQERRSIIRKLISNDFFSEVPTNCKE